MTVAKSKTNLNMTRRGLLAGASALSLLSLSQIPQRAFAAEIDADGFLKLSQKLVKQEDLYEDIAAKMLDAFVAAGKEEEIAALVAGEDNPPLANEVVAAWYTGVSPDPADLEVLTYTDALIWEAMDYTKPLGYCGGGVGYWAEPPAS